MRLCPTCKGDGIERIHGRQDPTFNVASWTIYRNRDGQVIAGHRQCRTCDGQEIIPDPTCGVPLIPRREVRS